MHIMTDGNTKLVAGQNKHRRKHSRKKHKKIDSRHGITIINNTISMSFSQGHEEISIPFPPCLYKYDNKTHISLSLGALLTLKSCLYKIVNTL